MSTFYSIDITLQASYTEKNIEYILNQGLKLGLIYYDFEDRNIVMQPHEATKIVINNLEGGEEPPHVYAILGESSVFLWFFMTEGGDILFSFGGFGIPI